MDDIDKGILSALLADGRATYGEIGAQVGLSAPAVKRRVDKLRDSGVVRGYTAIVDPQALGWTTEAYVELFCKGVVSPHDLRKALEKVPEVVGACTVSGTADAVVHILAADVRSLEVALEKIRADKHVDHTESAIVLSRLIDRGR